MTERELFNQWTESMKAKEDAEKKFCSYLETDTMKINVTDLEALKKILSSWTFKALENMLSLAKKEKADFEEWIAANNNKVLG